ncbi:MAG: hypothetical protein FVQ79_05650 [Planctomycetes bacterium]|nr:hypothetical protein [Planctomycetota bacterium]
MHKAKSELEFEISSRKQLWLTGGNKIGKGPLKPSHVAELFIRNLPREQYKSKSDKQYHPISNFSSFGVMKKLLETSAGQSMSRQQRDLVTTGNVICQIGKISDEVGNHTHFRLYATTQDDAKKTAEAFVDFLISRANRNLEPLLIKQQELNKKIVDNKNSIAETEAKLGTVQTELDELKKTVHYLSASEAKNTISKLNTRIDDLNITLAEMRAKQEATNQSLQRERKKKTTQDANLGPKDEVTELMGKLEAAMAKNKTAAIIRNQAVTKLKAAQSKLYKLKKTAYDLSDKKIKATLLNLYKIVDEFSTIFTTVLSELEVANAAWEDETKETGLDTELKLEQRLQDQKTELEVLEASKKTAANLREQAERFYYLAQQVSQLQDSKKSLNSELLDSENAFTKIEEKLANPGQELLPPEVYQNKVTVYPTQSGFMYESTQ